MKNYHFLLLTGFLLLSLSACEDILEREELDVIPASQVLNTLGGVEAVLFQVYEITRSVHENNELSLYKQCGTDLVVNGTHMVDVNAGGMQGINTYSNGLVATSDPLSSMWDGYYRAISNCNLVVQASENFPTSNSDEQAALLRFRGEALALRAYVYLELVRRWGNIPLAVPLPEGSEPVREAPLSPASDIYALIVADLNEAVQLLPPRSQTSGVGAPSRGLANLLLAEAHLDLGNNAEAAAAAEAVIDDDSYNLQPLTYIFGLEGGKEGEENNEEIILSWVFDPAIQARPQRTVQMYVPLYDRVPGVARSLGQGARPWGRLSPSDYYWSLFDDDDGRLEAWHKLSWVIDEEENVLDGWDLRNGDEVPQEYVIAWADGAEREARYMEPTTTKTWEDGTYGRLDSDAEGFRNVIVYRYAQAYLAAAEAHLKNGNASRATELVNVLRDRAFGDAEHRFTTLTMETFMEEYARELGHEGHRWYILKRNNLLLEQVKMHNRDAAPNIQEYHRVWPIPQSFIDLAGVAQNPGY